MATKADLLRLQQEQDEWEKKQAAAKQPSADDSMLPNWIKVLGSGIEQGGTGLAGLPGVGSDIADWAISKLPDSVREAAQTAKDVTSPVLPTTLIPTASKMPNPGVMDQALRDAGLQHTPQNYGEDLAQNAISAAVQGAATGGSGLWGRLAAGAEQLIPATAGKIVGDNLQSPTAGLVATMLAALGQHTVKHIATPEASVARAVGEDVGDSQLQDFREYNRLGVPAIAADVVPSKSDTAAEIADAVHKYPKKAKGLTATLQDRAANAGGRIQGYLEDATGTTMTADQAETALTNALDRRTTGPYAVIATSNKDSNHAGAIALTSRYLNPSNATISNIPTKLQNIMNNIRERLVFQEGESGANRPNYSVSAAYEARNYIDKVVKENPEYAATLKPIRDNLTDGIAYSHPEIKDLDTVTATKQAQLDALKAGRDFAKRGRKEDVSSFFQSLGEQPNGEELQKAFRLGYGDKLIEGVQNTPITGKAVTPANTRGQSSELTELYGPDTAQKRDAEVTFNKTEQQYNLQPAKPKGVVEAIRHAPGFGFGAIGAAGGLTSAALGLAGTGGALPVGLLAGASGLVSLTKLIRDPKLAKAYIKAAGIDNADELVKFIKKGDIGTYRGAAAKAGIINLLNGAR